MRGNQVEFLTKKLNLTPDQVTQVKAIEDVGEEIVAGGKEVLGRPPSKRQ